MRHSGSQAFVKGFPENSLSDTEITSTFHKCPSEHEESYPFAI